MSGIKKSHLLFNQLFEASCYVLVFSLFFSRAILAFSIAFIFIFSLLSHSFQTGFKAKFSLKFVLFPIIYWITIFSVLITSDINAWIALIIKNATLFCIPFGFLFADELSKNSKIKLLKFFAILVFFCLTTTSIAVLISNITISQLAIESKNIQPILGPGHIELGLLSAIGFIIMCKFSIESRSCMQKGIWILMALLCFVCLHILAYRFGLFTIYIVSIIYIFYSLVTNPKKVQRLLMFLAVPVIAVVLYFSIDSFKNRIINTKADIESIFEEKNPNFQSVHQRWAAIKCTSEIIKINPWIGVSPADLSSEMQNQYNKNSYLLIPENRIFIHNQIMFYAASYGIPFVLLFVFAFLYILFKESRYSYFQLLIMIPFLLHMQIDNTLEKQITASAMLFFLFLLSEKNKELYQ